MAEKCDRDGCDQNAIHGTRRCLQDYDPERTAKPLPGLQPLDGPVTTRQATTVIPTARPYQPEPAPADDEDKPDDEEYGQPVRFHEAAPVGLFQRLVQRLQARKTRT